MAARVGSWQRRGWRPGVVIVVVLVVAAVAASARLFVWPARDAPSHADAIVMFNGEGDRMDYALQLARAHRAPNFVVSQGGGSYCPPPIAGVAITCFQARPMTTRGEAEFAGKLASRYHWRSLLIVTSQAQDTRARLRMKRCFKGTVHVSTVPLRARLWVPAVAYEWGATFKALLLQRSC